MLGGSAPALKVTVPPGIESTASASTVAVSVTWSPQTDDVGCTSRTVVVDAGTIVSSVSGSDVVSESVKLLPASNSATRRWSPAPSAPAGISTSIVVTPSPSWLNGSNETGPNSSVPSDGECHRALRVGRAGGDGSHRHRDHHGLAVFRGRRRGPGDLRGRAPRPSRRSRRGRWRPVRRRHPPGTRRRCRTDRRAHRSVLRSMVAWPLASSVALVAEDVDDAGRGARRRHSRSR